MNDYVHIHTPSRIDVFDFLGEKDTKTVLELLEKDNATGLFELEQILESTQNPPMWIGALYPPPLGEPDVEKIGNILLYRGSKHKLNGVWKFREDEYEATKKIQGEDLSTVPFWSQLKTKKRAMLSINKEVTIKHEELLPENFLSHTNLIKNHLRQVYELTLTDGTKIFVKSARPGTVTWFDSTRPHHRAINLQATNWFHSKGEIKKNDELANIGVPTPKSIGYYSAPFEQYAFFEKIQGDYPDKFYHTHKEDIIFQDAAILARLCLSGYTKTGFTDVDDKIFDGKTLYLIDVDEMNTSPLFDDKRKLQHALRNPNGNNLNIFRTEQKKQSEATLYRVIDSYRSSLLQSDDDAILYEKSFFKTLKEAAYELK